MNFKKISAIACAMTIIGGMSSATTVHAAGQYPQTGQTPVVYDNRNIVDPDGNGVWGVAIPTAITFTDENQTADADIELVGLNGYSLSDFTQLDVDGTVQSQNAYKMIGEGSASGSEASYSYQLKSTTFTADGEEQDIEQLTLSAPKQEGIATLKTKGTKKGQHKDKLTFTFTGTSQLR